MDLDGNDCVTARTDRFNRGKHYTGSCQTAGKELSRSGRLGKEKSLSQLPGFEPWTVEPLAQSLNRLRYPPVSCKVFINLVIADLWRTQHDLQFKAENLECLKWISFGDIPS